MTRGPDALELCPDAVRGEPEWGIAARCCVLRHGGPCAMPRFTSGNGLFRPVRRGGVGWRCEGEGVWTDYPRRGTA
jgi:hypothetical protein